MRAKQGILRGSITAALVVLLSGMFAPVASADAANPDGAFNVIVSPPSIGLEAKPGVPISTDIRVQNQGLATEHVAVSLMKFTAEGDTGLPKLADLQSTDDFASWLKFSTTQFDAAPNVWQTVKVTISPPKTAAFGYYYAVVFSRQGAAKTIQKQKANLLGAVASLILLDVTAPGAVRQVSIADFSTTNKTSEFLPVSFNVKLHNTGNVHVATRGSIDISRNGQHITALDVNAQNGFILPQSNRNFTASWSDGTPAYKVQKDAHGQPILDKNGNTVSKLDWNNFSMSKLRFGKYDARLVMIYNDGHGDISTEARLSFWVIPWRIIAAIVAVALFILAGLWALVIRPIRGRINRSRGHALRR